MKILHVIPSLTLKTGGTSSAVRELCRGLSCLGMEIHLWTTQHGYDPHTDVSADQQLQGAGVHLRYFPFSSIPWFGKRYAHSPALRAALYKELSSFDLVHIHTLWLYPTFMTARVCRWKNIPYLLSPCGMLDPYSLRVRGGLKKIYAFLIERRTLAEASAIHFTSLLEQKKSSVFGTTSPSIVVPCSLQLEEIPSIPPGQFRYKHPEIGQRQILLFLGRLHPKKRLDLVAKTFAVLAHKRNDLHLVLAGPDDGAKAQTYRLLEKAHCLHQVTFTSLLTGKEKWSAIQESCLFLLPSEDENFGIAVLEAMAMGIPVLLSDRVGLASAAAQAKAGVILERNVDVWVKTVEQLLDDPEQRREMGNAGIHLAKTEFSTDQISLRMQSAYKKILEGVTK